MEFSPKAFEISTIRNDAIIFIIGKEDTGKTTLIKELFNNSNIKDISIFDKKKDYDYLSDKATIYDVYKEELLDDIVRSQKKRKRISEDKSHVVVVDDTIDNIDRFRSKNFMSIFLNGRFLRLGLICSMSYPYKLSPAVSCNTDYIFMFNDTNIENMIELHHRYGHIFDTFDEFYKVFQKITSEPNSCLVLNYCSKTNNLEDIVFSYKI
jgi:GTPase SAR1 family protein